MEKDEQKDPYRFDEAARIITSTFYAEMPKGYNDKVDPSIRTVMIGNKNNLGQGPIVAIQNSEGQVLINADAKFAPVCNKIVAELGKEKIEAAYLPSL